MKRIIAACGNDCSKCPRHLPKTEEELQETAKLWFEIGYREHIVSTDEISCTGCTTNNWCRYNIVKCVAEKGISTCGGCDIYPCSTVKECFKVTSSFIPQCKKVCTSQQYNNMKEAFFEKEKNLDLIYKNISSNREECE